MRAGELSEERVGTAAFLNDPAALCLTDGSVTWPESRDASERRMASLQQQWPTARPRVVTAVARKASPYLGRLKDATARQLSRGLVNDLDAFVMQSAGLQPSTGGASRLFSQLDPLQSLNLGPLDKVTIAAALVCCAARACLGDDESALGVSRWSSDIWTPPLAWRAARDEVVPWALGLRDPVAERVAARNTTGD